MNINANKIISGGLYSLIGAHIAHVLTDWHEDKMNFFVICRGIGLPLPIPNGRKDTRAIFTNQRLRFIRLLTIVLWILSDAAVMWYFNQGRYNLRKAATITTSSYEVGSMSYSCRFFSLISGLLLGLSLTNISDHKNKQMKKILRIISACLFVGMLVLLFIYDYNNYLQNYSGTVNSNCSLDSFTKVCHVKCYCGIDVKNGTVIDSNIFNDCNQYKICNPTFRDVGNWNESFGCQKYRNLFEE